MWSIFVRWIDTGGARSTNCSGGGDVQEDRPRRDRHGPARSNSAVLYRSVRVHGESPRPDRASLAIGTDGSNPSPSSGEAIANLTFGPMSATEKNLGEKRLRVVALGGRQDP